MPVEWAWLVVALLFRLRTCNLFIHEYQGLHSTSRVVTDTAVNTHTRIVTGDVGYVYAAHEKLDDTVGTLRGLSGLY